MIVRLLIDGPLAIDDLGDNCAFTTKTHNPFFEKTNVQARMENFAENGDKDIVFDREIKFAKSMKDIRDEIRKGKRVYLQFLIVEKPKHTGMFTKDTKISYED